jgi:hypothetical protein
MQAARIIVSIFLELDEDPTDMVASASFQPLVAVFQECVGVQACGAEHRGRRVAVRPVSGPPFLASCAGPNSLLRCHTDEAVVHDRDRREDHHH